MGKSTIWALASRKELSAENEKSWCFDSFKVCMKTFGNLVTFPDKLLTSFRSPSWIFGENEKLLKFTEKTIFITQQTWAVET